MMGLDVEKTGKRIYEMAVKHFGSAIEVADFLGVSKTAVYNWRNACKMPAVENLVLLSEAMGCTMESMIVRREL